MNAPVRRLKRPYRSVDPVFGRRTVHAARQFRRPANPARRLLAVTLIFGAIAAGYYLPGHLTEIAARFPVAEKLLSWLPDSRPDQSPAGLDPADRGLVSARAMPICGSGYRRNCVVDGDTIWVDHEKIRLETIDAPEVHGRCADESELAAKATRRLHTLLSDQPMTIVRSGHDIYGRTLARVSTDRGEVGGIMVNEELVRRWTGRRQPWC